MNAIGAGEVATPQFAGMVGKSVGDTLSSLSSFPTFSVASARFAIEAL
jgi:hypothetical protein